MVLGMAPGDLCIPGKCGIRGASPQPGRLLASHASLCGALLWVLESLSVHAQAGWEEGCAHKDTSQALSHFPFLWSCHLLPDPCYLSGKALPARPGLVLPHSVPDGDLSVP